MMGRIVYWLISTFLLLGNAIPALAQIEIEIYNTPEKTNDAICWTPVPAQIRQVGGSTPLEVTLRSTQANPKEGTGEVLFALSIDGVMNLDKFKSIIDKDSVTLTLPADGTPVPFFVAGKSASRKYGDVSIQVIAQEQIVHEHPLMVRVRKDATTLSGDERDRLLNALIELKTGNNHENDYDDYLKWHASTPFHGVEGFLPWHRAFVLSLERDLQQIDPSITIPYWKYGENASEIFSPEFLGTVDSSNEQLNECNGLDSNNKNSVRFACNHPFRSSTNSSDRFFGDSFLLRDFDGDNMTVFHPKDSEDVANIAEGIALDRANSKFTLIKVFLPGIYTNYGDLREPLEKYYHDDVHVAIGGSMKRIQTSPKDPLFFLLHAEVDHAWAQWQQSNHAYNPNEITSYSLLGTPTPSSEFSSFNSYAERLMYPWDDKEIGSSKVKMPKGAVIAPNELPRVKEFIDYLGILNADSQLGFCYDDVPYEDGR